MTNKYQPLQKLLEYIGFEDFKIEPHEEEGKFSVFVYDDSIRNASRFLQDFESIIRLIARKNDWFAISVDINNYRKERERLIVELAKAAARKATLTKEEISLPPMNSYERRLIHAELATRPDVKTESIGDGVERRIIVKITDI